MGCTPAPFSQLDENKHGLRVSDIIRIDLVFACKLTDEKLKRKIAKPDTERGICVEFHSIDRLVNAVLEDFHLARSLGLSADTEQILIIEEFIEHNEPGPLKVGTPLSNEFAERDEYAQLEQQLHEANIVILRVAPGYGKTNWP